MEVAFAGVIIAAAMAVAVWSGIHMIHMTQAVEALSLTSVPKYNEIIYHSIHGQWPSAGNVNVIARDDKGAYVNNVMLGKDGAITAEMTLGPLPATGAGNAAGATHGLLSFRPELLGSPDAPTITFLCGYAKPVVTSTGTSAANRTTLDSKDLPSFCR